MNITSIAFPCVSYDKHLSLESLLIADSSPSTLPDQSSLLIQRIILADGGVNCKAQLKQLALKQPLSFIENTSSYQDESSFPLLIRIPSNFHNFTMKLKFEYDSDELDQLKQSINEKLAIFEELFLIKVEKDNDLDIILNNLIKDSKSNEDRVRPLGSINILQSGNAPIQSLLQEKLSHNYTFPTPGSPIKINTSFSLNPTDHGKITFYLVNRSQGKITKLLKFSIWKDEKLPKTSKPLTSNENGNNNSPVKRVINFKNEMFPFPLADGPDYRLLISNFEEKIPQMKQLLSQALANGKQLENLLLATSEAKIHFINSLKSFVADNPFIKDLIDQSIEPLLRNSANDDVQLVHNLKMNILTPMSSVPAHSNINALTSNKKIFEDESQKYYAWLNKYLSSGKSKDEKFLGKKKAFELSKFDYLTYLHDVGSNSSSTFELLNYFISFVNNIDKNQSLILIESPKDIQKTLDKQGNEKKLLRRKIDHAKTEKELANLLDAAAIKEDSKQLYKSGILYTYGGQGKQGWHKQWIVLNNSSLIEYADWRKGRERRGSLIDIALCSIKPITQDKRKNCFEIITSKGQKNIYQAMSESERDSWIKLLYDAGQLIRFNNSAKTKSMEEVIDGRKRRVSSVSLKNLSLVQNLDQSNLKCCDCGSSEGVEWISLNLLIIFCVQCSSSHRNLGTSISKVRSLKLDNFSSEQMSLISYINNAKFNEYYEFISPSMKINPNSSDQERLDFIVEKYKNRRYLEKLPSNTSPNNILLHGFKERNFNEILWALALGVNLEMTLEKNNQEFTLIEYALTKPIEQNDVKIYDLAEFLLLNGVPLTTKINKNLNLEESAVKFWKDKMERIYGTVPAKESFKGNYGNGANSSINPHGLLKISTKFEDDNTESSERKFLSPSSATARYSKIFIKKMNH